LWRVEGVGRPSHILGTIHLGIEADRELPARVWREVDDSKLVVLEVAPTDMQGASQTATSYLPGGQDLEDRLGPKTWRNLARTMAPHDIEWLRARTPWFAYTAVLRALFPTQRPIDDAIAKRAVSQGTPIRGLESLEFQLQTLNRFADVDDLADLVADDGQEVRDLRALIAAYRNGDRDFIARISANADPEYERIVFRERNQRWAKTLEPVLSSGGAFVAVGVGHLLGPGNLIELLREHGFSIAPAGQIRH
jgi:uncharacterized protein YbaP (TraB family)